MVAASGVALTAAGLAATLAAERWNRPGLRRVAKPAASLGFVIVAFASGALGSGYGAWILAGLLLSLAGDVLLLFDDPLRFLAGLAAFLAGHVAYAAGFVVAGVAAACAGAAALGAIAVAAVVLPWLWPHVGPRMRGPVLAYVAVISAMLALAVGTLGAGHTALAVVGAALFYTSDLFVARDRFVTPGFANALVGLPLYYAGQVLLALSIGG